MDTSTFQWISQEVSSNINSILLVTISTTRTLRILTKQRRGGSTCLIRKFQCGLSKPSSTKFTKNRWKKASRQNLPIHRCKLTVNQIICFKVNLTTKCWRYHQCQTRWRRLLRARSCSRMALTQWWLANSWAVSLLTRIRTMLITCNKAANRCNSRNNTLCREGECRWAITHLIIRSFTQRE